MTTEHPPLTDAEIAQIRVATKNVLEPTYDPDHVLARLFATLDAKDGIIEGLRQEVLDAGALYAEQGRLLHHAQVEAGVNLRAWKRRAEAAEAALHHAQETIEALRAERDDLLRSLRALRMHNDWERERDEAVALVAKMRRFVTGTAAGRPLMPSIDALLAEHPRQEGTT